MEYIIITCPVCGKKTRQHMDGYSYDPLCKCDVNKEIQKLREDLNFAQKELELEKLSLQQTVDFYNIEGSALRVEIAAYRYDLEILETSLYQLKSQLTNLIIKVGTIAVILETSDDWKELGKELHIMCKKAEGENEYNLEKKWQLDQN